mgnify:CR=1 FL=1
MATNGKGRALGQRALVLAAALCLGALAPWARAGCGCGGDGDDHDDDGVELRETARQAVSLSRVASPNCTTVDVKLLGINDFHGQLSTGRTVAGRPVGSAAVLASYLLAAARDYGDRAFLVHAGDHVGASPPASALLQDEPSIEFLNLMNKRLGGRGKKKWQVVGALGNHEFDEGRAELLRLLKGGNHPNGPFLEDPWGGSDVPYVCANVVDTATGKTLLPAFQIRSVAGIKIGFVGAVTKTTPTIVTPSGVAGLTFRDEADAINDAVGALRREGVETIVVLIHEGGSQSSFTGDTRAAGAVSGTIVSIVDRLDDAVDVVVSGHTHSFTNAVLTNAHGTPMLVTQSFSASTAYSDIRLTIDCTTGDVTHATAAVVTTWADDGPGLNPVAEIAQLAADAEASVAPLVNQVIGTASAGLTRTQNGAGESDLGNFIADAQRAAMGTDVAFMNPGGVRADLAAGTVTWGALFTIQPFGNSLVQMDLTGAQIDDLLEQQWSVNRVLQPSGITYTWDAAQPVGQRVALADIFVNGAPIDATATYTVTVNSFLAGGGDGFTVLLGGTSLVGGAVDLDALIAYVQSLAQPFGVPTGGRITRLN